MAKKPDSKKSASKKSTAPDRNAVLDRAVDAAMGLAAQLGWCDLTLADIASEAGLDLATLYGVCRSKTGLLTRFMRRIDGTVLAAASAADLSEPLKDRLFDVIMQRFDALQPWRGAVQAIARDIPFDPVAALCLGCNRHRSSYWMLEKAGVSTGGLRGRVRAAGLDLITLSTVRVWLKDDSRDMSVTMAHLDKQLDRADSLVRSLQGGFQGGRHADQDVPEGTA